MGRPSSLFGGGETLVAGLDPLEYAASICIPCMLTYASCGWEGGSRHARVTVACMSTLLSGSVCSCTVYKAWCCEHVKLKQFTSASLTLSLGVGPGMLILYTQYRHVHTV